MIASFINILGKLKFALLTLLFMSLFISLGVWQWNRANEKERLLQQYALRSANKLPLSKMDVNQDLRFYPVQLEGRFDQPHTFYLDNKTYQGKPGYEVYTPFKAKGLAQPILIDRGWIALGENRATLPALPAVPRTVKIEGILVKPPAYFVLGALDEKSTLPWPKRIEYIDLQILSKLLGYPLFPYVLKLETGSPYGFTQTWQAVMVKPEKHRGYAVQWFAFALTLLILFVVLNWKRTPKE